MTSLTKLTTVQLTVYHLEVLGYLPPSENNNGKNQLAKIILDAKESGLNFYKELPCSEIKNQVMGKAVGYYYKNNRDETRKTLVEHLQDADVSFSLSRIPPLVSSSMMTSLHLSLIYLTTETVPR